MKEGLEEELLRSLDTVRAYLTKGAEFASEQVPIVVEEIVRFNLFYSAVSILLGMVFLVLSAPLIRSTIRLAVKNDEGALLTFALSAACLTASICLIAHNIKTFIMCLTAPRLFVIEYLGSLI